MTPPRIAFLGMAILVVAVNGSKSSAEDATSDIDAIFQRLDKNGDGKVSAGEIPQDQARYFERLLRRANKDVNGELTRDEFRQASKPEERPNVPLGNPDPEQARSDARQRFEMLDRNKDGKVTLDEVPEQVRDRLKPMFERSGKQELTFEEFARLAARRPEPAEIFKRFDANADGKLSRDELPAEMRERLEPLYDRLGKNELTLEEFTQARDRSRDGGARSPEGERTAAERSAGERPAGDRNVDAPRDMARNGERRPEGLPREGRGPMLFRLLDINHDGHVSREEFAKITEMYDQLDRNHDGQLEPQELIGLPPGMDGRRAAAQGAAGSRESARSESARAEADRPESGRRADTPSRDQSGAREEGGRNQGAPFQRLDRDGDGKISKEEAPPFLKDKFAMLDTNGDGFVTQDEFRAGAQMMLHDGARARQSDGSGRSKSE